MTRWPPRLIAAGTPGGSRVGAARHGVQDVAKIDGARLRRTLLEVVSDNSRLSGNKMESASIIQRTCKQLEIAPMIVNFTKRL
jgi:hypothetical protein